MASGANTQTAHFALTSGIDERTHPRHLQPPKLIRCENGRLTRSGAISKRYGNTALSNVGSGADATRLTSYRSEIVAHDRRYLRTFSPKNAEFEIRGYAHEAVCASRTLVSTATGQCNPDVTYNATAGVIVYAWSDATSPAGWGRVRTKVIDALTGAELQAATIVEDAFSFGTPRVASVGGETVLVYNKDASANIYGRVLSSDGKSWSSPTTIKNNNSSGGEFEIAALVGTLYLAYQNSTPRVAVCTISVSSSTFTVDGTYVTTESLANIFSFGLQAYSGEWVTVTYCGDTGAAGVAKALAVNLLCNASVMAPTTLWSDATILPSMAYPVRLEYDLSAVVISAQTASGNCVMSCNVTISGASATDPADRRTYWCALASKPFIRSDADVVYAWVYSGGARYTGPTLPAEQDRQFSLHLVDVNAVAAAGYPLPARPVCVEAPRFAYRQNNFMKNAPTAARISDALWLTVGEARLSNDGRNGLLALFANFDSPSSLGQPAELGGAAQYAPGYSYDGARAVEYSFCYWPQEVSVAFVTGGSLSTTARYRWRAVYVFIDDAGQVYRSAPSDYTEETPSDTKAQVTAPMLCLTNKQQAVGASVAQSIVGIEIYRTTADPTDDTPYYLVHSVVNTPQNEPSEESVTYEDGAADATISTNAQIYTQGGALRRVQPPSFTAQTTYRGRIWGAHGSALWYSGAFIEGEAPWWSDAFVQPLGTSDDITALWVMDDTLYVSTARAIYYLQAEGPTDTGAQNDIGTPYRVATDFGCTEPRSVVVTPIGTLFLSSVGIHLLSRARQVPPQVFGLRVQDTLAAYPTIVSATLHPTGGYVLFWCTNGSTSARIVYDYTADEWFTDTSALFSELRSAAYAAGLLCWLNETAVYYENTATYLDGGSFVVRDVELADFHPTGVQGFMKFLKAQLLADNFTSHGLTVKFAKDYSASYFDTRPFTDAEIDALGLEQLSITPSDNRCQAMRVRILDSAPTTGDLDTGKGSDFIALSFDFDPLGNQFQLPSGARK